jgi:hypothetical protein
VSTTLGVIKSWLALLVAAFLLTGCLDGGDGGTGTAATSISGTAATGAAMTGTVDLVDANGVTRNVTIGANGAFLIDTTGLAAPMILRANGNGGAVILFSLADGLTGVFNITPLTNLALEVLRQGDAGGPADLAAMFVGWNGLADPADLAEIQSNLRNALARVNANLQAVFDANGVDETTFDFLRIAFTPNGNGIDGVLDDIRVVFGEGGVVINNPAGALLGNFNFQINIAGFNIGGGGGGAGGAGTMTLAVSVSGIAGLTVTVPNEYPEGFTESDFCGVFNDPTEIAELQDQIGAVGSLSLNSCSFSGSVGVVAMTLSVTTPVAISVPYTLTYTFN